MKANGLPNKILAANFRHLLSSTPHKTAYTLDAAVTDAKKANEVTNLDELSTEQQLLVALPTGRTLYNLQKGSQTPNKNTLDGLVDFYNHFNPTTKITAEEFLTIDLANYYNRFCTNGKRETFSGLYSCYYLTLYDSEPVGALLYLDFQNIKSLRAVLVTEISSDTVLHDKELEVIVQMASDTDTERIALKQAFVNYKGTAFSKERLQLMLSSNVEITDKSLSVTFAHVDDPKKQLSIGLNISRFTEHRTIYHGGSGIAFSNHNTINGLAAFRMILASRENLLPISLKHEELREHLKRGNGDILHVSDRLDALSFRFLSQFKKE